MALAPNAPMGKGLTFTGMTHSFSDASFDLKYLLVDKSLGVQLCVGQEENRVLITGTSPKSLQSPILEAIDQFGKWGQTIQLWMVAKKDGVTAARTAPVNYLTHVKPYYGKLKISEIAADQPAMTYPGNGKGRVLTKPINDRYYFYLNGKLETEDAKRGLDCTTFPMALFGLRYLPPPGYGKQLAETLHAAPCGYEQKKRADLEKEFRENTTPPGLFILFSETHVLLYNSDLNTLYEFTYGGYKSMLAGLRPMPAPNNLWWMRKLNESYRLCFM